MKNQKIIKVKCKRCNDKGEYLDLGGKFHTCLECTPLEPLQEEKKCKVATNGKCKEDLSGECYYCNRNMLKEDKEWKNKAKEHFFKGDWEEEFDKKFKHRYYAENPDELRIDIKDFIRSLLSSTQKEHCAEPECPECNLKAYQKGRADAKGEIRQKLLKGFTYNSKIGTEIMFKDTLDDILTEL